MGQTGLCENQRFPAVFCENLRFPAKICASEMVQFPGKAKICKKQRECAQNREFGSVCPFWFVPIFPLENSQKLAIVFSKSQTRSHHLFLGCCRNYCTSLCRLSRDRNPIIGARKPILWSSKLLPNYFAKCPVL